MFSLGRTPISGNVEYHDGSSVQLDIAAGCYIFDANRVIQQFCTPNGRGGYWYYFLASVDTPERQAARAISTFLANIGIQRAALSVDAPEIVVFVGTKVASSIASKLIDELVDKFLPSQMCYVDSEGVRVINRYLTV